MVRRGDFDDGELRGETVEKAWIGNHEYVEPWKKLG